MLQLIKVTKLPVDHGTSGWNALLPVRKAYPPLQADRDADFLVIGAGFAGISAAKRLSHNVPEAKIILLEANEISAGPAGRNSGFMIDLPHDLQSEDYASTNRAKDRHEILDNRLAIDFAESMALEAGLNAEGFARCGKINGAATAAGEHHIKTYAAQLTALDEAHQVLDAGDMKAITGSDYYSQGLYTPGAAMIQPAKYVQAIAARLASNRLHVFENSAVTSLGRNGNTWSATTAAGWSVKAPKVILAVNGHLGSFGFAKRHIMHVFTYASMTRALTHQEVSRLGGQPTWGLTPADPLGTSVRRISGTGGERLLVRNRFTYDASMEITQARVEATGRDHDASFAARFPMLKGVEMEHRWGGRLALTRNGVTIFGALGPGLYSACVQNGIGVAKGTFHGMMAADLATDRHSEHLERLLGQPKPQRLLPEPVMSLGANGYLRLNEWRAGKEY